MTHSPLKLLDDLLDSPEQNPDGPQKLKQIYQAMRHHLSQKGYEYYLFNQHYWLANLDPDHKKSLQDLLKNLPAQTSESLIISARLLGHDFIREHLIHFKKNIIESPDFQAFELIFALHSNKIDYPLSLAEDLYNRQDLPPLLRSYLGQFLLEIWFLAENRAGRKDMQANQQGLTGKLIDFPGAFKNFDQQSPELLPLKIYLENLCARKFSLTESVEQAPIIAGFLPSAFFRPLRPLQQMCRGQKSDLKLPFKPEWRHRPMGRHAIIISFDWSYWQRYGQIFLSSLAEHSNGAILHLIPVDFNFSKDELDGLETDHHIKINISQFDGEKAVEAIIARGIAPQRRKIMISLAAFARYLHLPDLLAFYNLLSISDLDGRWAPGGGSNLSRPGLGLCYSPDKNPEAPQLLPWQIFHAGRMALRGGAMTSSGGEEKLSRHIRDFILKALDHESTALDLWYSDQIAIAAAIGAAIAPRGLDQEKLSFRFDQLLFEQIWPKLLAPAPRDGHKAK